MKHRCLGRLACAAVGVSMALSPVTALAQTQTPMSETLTWNQLLNETIKSAEECKTEGVNSIVVAYFNTALSEAKAVAAKADASDDECKAAWQKLSDAMHYLEFKDDMRGSLEALIKDAEKLTKDQFDDKGWTALQDAIAAAKEVAGRDTALNDALSDAFNNLQAAINGEKMVVIYRAYNPNDGDHLFTKSKYEWQNAINHGWNNEGTAWKSPEEGSVKVMRVYDPNSGEHHYTSDANEVRVLKSLGWRDEGEAWKSDDSKRIGVYRLYNPNETRAGRHHYTHDEYEVSVLEAAGWINEDIGFHAAARS